MTKQLTIFGTLEADFTVKPWVDPGCTRVYPETPVAARDETLAALEDRMTKRLERVKAGGK